MQTAKQRQNHNTTPYTPEFKAEMIRRMTGPYSVAARSLARETGVAQATLSAWLRDARSVSPVSKRERTPEEKLRLVMAASTLEGEQLGAFLRKEGVTDVELRDWKKAMVEALAGGRPPPKKSDEELQIRRLQKELARKDKALAEVAAIAVLKKKLRELGLSEDEDDSTNGGTEKP